MMKKSVIAAAALMAFAGSASAADLAPHPYTKAPPPIAPVYNWTGFYVFGGGGGGLWAADSNVVATGPSFLGPTGTPLTRDQRLGGSGWFGTVGAGFDWQFAGSWVAGVFADGQFGNLHGSLSDPFGFTEGQEKLQTSYAVGGRLGYLVAPNVLSYVNAGWSGSQWSGTTQTTLAPGGGFIVAATPSFHRNGWFVGGGVENSLNIFGISAPGWFMKTEYRAAFYNRITLPETLAPGVFLMGPPTAVTFKPWDQTVSTSIVYRFNWGGPPIAARY